MKNINYLSIIVLLLTGYIQGVSQVDEVSVGARYARQAYYSLETGDTTSIDNKAWDIAFSALGQQDAAIHINESAAFMGSPLKLYIAHDANWSTTIDDTSGFTDSLQQSNPEKSWTHGAFNQSKNAKNPLDFGWGIYNTSSHNIVGNKVFVIRKRDKSFIKFQIKKLDKSGYHIRFADLDGKNESSATIAKKDAINGLVHFSFDTGKVNMPASYDLIFQRYKTLITTKSGASVPYTVTGVLLAPHVEAVVADGIDPKNVDFDKYKDSLTSKMDIIGHTWKSFSFTTGWEIDADRTHFIKTKSGDVYQVTFLDFAGSSSGVTSLKKTKVFTSSLPEDKEIVKLDIYPNPASEYMVVSAEHNEQVSITLVDMQGRVVKSISARTQERINISTLPRGIYRALIKHKGHTLKRSIVIK